MGWRGAYRSWLSLLKLVFFTQSYIFRGLSGAASTGGWTAGGGEY